MTKLLLGENDLNLIRGLSFAIKKQGYKLDIAITSREADTSSNYAGVYISAGA